jgi:16S rRNA G1207 methylase RsmC
MAGVSLGSTHALAEQFDFTRYDTVCDVGGATGLQSMVLARRYPELHCTTYDLPVVAPIAEKAIAAAGLSDRVTVASGDFFADPLPRADVVVMGQILHDWNLDRKMQLISAAYDAVPDGGAFIAVESLIDDARRENVFGLMMSLNMLVEFGDAFDYTGSDFAGWCREIGFREVDILPLGGPTSAAIAYK